MLCVHTKFPIYYVHLVFMKSKYVPKIQMFQDVPNSKTICHLISTLVFNLYKCGKWSFIVGYNKWYIHLT
jgi:hypothetical protein